jgi:asparagine synthase (glutamine-hydrolysing)
MCGIAGIALKPGRALPDMPRRLAAMRDAMQHRGPDDAGIYLAPDEMLGLVNCRLAIRDLSPAGHMPMATADQQLWMSYNGEIYNADELRACLVQQGYRFRSQSDTEVILLGYQAWGEQVLERLRGMFAFVIFDNRRPDAGRLFLARDRLGIKPLYYAQSDAGLVFASELKALLAAGMVNVEIDPTALVAYLMLGSVPDPLSIYRGVRALAPAGSLQVSPHDWHTVSVQHYWQFPEAGDSDLHPAEAVEQVAALLEDAVRSHLVSDVPLGAFLSGGLDSSSVVALMHALGAAPIRTCSMTFEEAAYNEADYAMAVAEATGSEHYARVITAADVQANLEHIWQAMDQPSIDGVNSYFVSQTAREAGLTVALSGLGGDELFGGYPNTFENLPRLLDMTQRMQRIPAAPALASRMLSLPWSHRRWLKIAAALQRPASPASTYVACRGLFAPAEVRSLVSAEVWQEAMATFDPVMHVTQNLGMNGLDRRSNREHDLFNWISRAELRHYTSQQLLRDTDVMSMAHSLEVRVPLLDDRLVEAVLRMPASVKASSNGHGPKPLLAQAMGTRLPAIVRERHDKRGFTFPFDVWLRGPLRRNGAAQPPALQGLLCPAGIGAVQRGFEAGRIHWSRPWALAVLEGWGALAP